MRRALWLLVSLATVAVSAHKFYDVIPYGNCIGTQPQGAQGVSQTLVNVVDSLCAVSVWIGDTVDTSSYNVDIVDAVHPTHRLAYKYGMKAAKCWAWLDFDLETDPTHELVRGMSYKVVVSRPTGAAISFAYDPRDTTYAYGCLSVGGIQHETWDLALRVEGLMEPPDTRFWGVMPGFPSDKNNQTYKDRFVAHASDIGFGLARFGLAWQWIQPDSSRTSFNFAGYDTEHVYYDSALGCQVLGDLSGCTGYEWSSSYFDTLDDTWNLACPPRNLFAAIHSDTNYWARYVERVVENYPDIHVWEIWNEPNDTCRSDSFRQAHPGVKGWWKRPNRSAAYDTLSAGLRPLVRLYARLCITADTLIRAADGHENDTIIVGAFHRVNSSSAWQGLVSGRMFLDTFYDVVLNELDSTVFWQGVSVHPYQYDSYFSASDFIADAETIRKVMRKNGDFGKLWVTEIGWHIKPEELEADRKRQADGACQTAATALASHANPAGGYDRFVLYSFHDYGDSGSTDSSGCLTEEFNVKRRSFYSFKQARSELSGSRFRRAVLMGDPRDDSVQVYEFDDPSSGKLKWVGWRSWPGSFETEPPPIGVGIPVRVKHVEWENCAYTDGDSTTIDTAALDGWFDVQLSTRPRFFCEPDSGTVARPDLVVDSLRFFPAQPQVGRACTLTACVRNTGSGNTGTLYGGMGFYRNGVLLNEVQTPDTSIDQGGGTTLMLVRLVFPVMPESLHGSGLFSATANPEDDYVELGTDDNSAWQRKYVHYMPTGTLDVVIPPGGRSDVPLVLLQLQTFSWEKDTSGATPADSVRVHQYWFGISDTVPQDSAVTDWFDGSVTDTCWSFQFGDGRYRFLVQARDSCFSPGPCSVGVYDDTCTVVVFDTSVAVGSISINSGSRFATGVACTVAVSVTDTVSGVHRMRLGTREPVDLARNSSQPSANDGWEISGGTYDGTLGLLSLPADSGTQHWARRFVPVSEHGLPGYIGDTVHLTADLLVSVPEAENDTIGLLVFEYWYVTPEEDTVWDGVAQVPITGGTSALCALSNIDLSFGLPDTSEEEEHVWGGGLIRVSVTGTEPTGGRVWFSNVCLEPASPLHEHSWWTAYDTLTGWDLESGSGWRTVYAVIQDSAGVENKTPFCDSVILDPSGPVVDISEPDGCMIDGTVEITGWAYDSIVVAGDTFFEWRRLYCLHADSNEYQAIDPDSVSFNPAWPDDQYEVETGVSLGYWNTTTVDNGEYWLKLVAQDSAGNESECEVQVEVGNKGEDGGGGAEEPLEAGGPPGGGSALGRGSVWVGSGTGWLLHLADDLTRLDSCTIADSGTSAHVAALLTMPNDSLVVADARAHALRKLGISGGNRRTLMTGLGLPTALCRAGNGDIWVCDRSTSTIACYSAAGALRFTRGGVRADSTERLSNPEGMAVANGYVYVADTRNNRVAVWDTAGDWVGEITGGFRSPQAVVIASTGRLYVIDKTTGDIEGINHLGGRLYSIADPYARPYSGLLLGPTGRYVYTLRPRDNAVVRHQVGADSSGRGGQQSGGTSGLPLRFVLHSPRPNPARRNLGIRYGVPWTARVTIRIYDITGRKARTLVNAEQKPGWYDITWDRRDDKGRSVPAGVYFCTLETPDHTSVKKAVLVR